MNPAFVELLGYSEEELLKMPINEMFHPVDREKSLHEIEKTFNGAPSKGFQNRLRRKDGSYIWLEWTTTPSSDESYFYASAKDISKRIATEEKLRSVIEDLETAQKIARLGYWIRDLQTDMNIWSDQVYRIYGKDPQQFTPTQQAVEDLFHPDDLQYVKLSVEKQFRENDFVTFEHRIITDKGEVKWLMERSHLIRDDQNRPVEMKGTVQDITETKQKEKELKISNERFEIAIKASNELIWDWDIETDKVNRSAGYEKFFGHDFSETEGSEGPWLKIIHPDDRESVKESLNSLLTDPDRKLNTHDYRVIRADGEIAHVTDRAFVIRDENGNPVRMVGAVLDVTKSKNLLERIRKQNKALKEITWMQSHTVRAPLSRILSIAELLKNGEVSNEEYEILFESVVTSAAELDEMVREVAAKTESLNRRDNGV
ncbi:MAG: PAS domain-containing protein [Balneolaceae bacterium]|nr:PAS domain-containing protein [Balneolaceae bacterium]